MLKTPSNITIFSPSVFRILKPNIFLIDKSPIGQKPRKITLIYHCQRKGMLGFRNPT